MLSTAPIASLTSLDLELNDESSSKGDGELSLRGLQGLQRVRLAGSFCSVTALGGVLRALWTLPQLRSLDLLELTCSGEGSEMGQLLKARPPSSSPLRHLLLPTLCHSKRDVAELRRQGDQLVEAWCRVGGGGGGGLEVLSSDLPLSAAAVSSLLLLPSLRALDLRRARIETAPHVRRDGRPQRPPLFPSRPSSHCCCPSWSSVRATCRS